MTSTPNNILITVVRPDGEVARTILRAYYDDIVGRYHGRPATTAEVDAVLVDEPSDDLTPPYGLFLVATDGVRAVGCAGLRLLPDGLGEVTRVFVAESARRRGVASRLLTELERAARVNGRSRLRLDTRHDLVEARRLYARHGYVEVERFNDSPYAAHWFAKSLG
ncbi:GNAT family N-acetyltransferase [Micromonospora pisi]|uniref:GNAT family N-acetyltransferase n=1 Tax=Micromonospora pisi TaxID=589240 RepID=UPI001FE93B14|nr:GNAT family N-acetyltransferase [Micromonospora pisi]